MSTISFSPGNLLTIANQGIVVVCGQDTPDDAFDELKAATDSNVESGLVVTPVRQLLEIEEFVVLVIFEGNVHLLHRGSLSIELAAGSASPTLIGNSESVSMVTWFETKLPLVWDRLNIYDPKLRRRTLRAIDSNFLSVSEVEIEPQYFFPSTGLSPENTVETLKDQAVSVNDETSVKVDQVSEGDDSSTELEMIDGADLMSESESVLDFNESDVRRGQSHSTTQVEVETNSSNIEEVDHKAEEVDTVEEPENTNLQTVDQELPTSVAEETIPEIPSPIDITREEDELAVQSIPQSNRESPEDPAQISDEHSVAMDGKASSTSQENQHYSNEGDGESDGGTKEFESRQVDAVYDNAIGANRDDQLFVGSSPNQFETEGGIVDEDISLQVGDASNIPLKIDNLNEDVDLADDGFNLEHTSTKFYQNMINFRKGIFVEPPIESRVEDQTQREVAPTFGPKDSDDQLNLDQTMAAKEGESYAAETQSGTALRDGLITNSPFASKMPLVRDEVVKPPSWDDKPLLPIHSPIHIESNTKFSPLLDEGFDIESTVNLKHKSQSSANAVIKHPISAVRCRSGHLNNPTLLNCPKCGQSIETQDAFTVERPVLGVIQFGDGSRYKIDGPKRIGRNPIRDSILEGESAETIIVGTGDNAISRDHVIITISQWQVLVTDNNSTNGTIVRRNDGRERRLNANRPEPIAFGSRIELSNDIWFDFIAEEM